MIGACLSVSIVSFAVIGYHCNNLDGQLNCQAFTHCIISRGTKLLTVQLVICGTAHMHRRHVPPHQRICANGLDHSAHINQAQIATLSHQCFQLPIYIEKNAEFPIIQ